MTVVDMSLLFYFANFRFRFRKKFSKQVTQSEHKKLKMSNLSPQDILIAAERVLIKNERENQEHIKVAIEIEDMTKKKAKKRIKRLQYQLKQKEKHNPDSTFTSLRLQINNLKLYHNANPSLHEQARVLTGLSIRDQLQKKRADEKAAMEITDREYTASVREQSDQLLPYLNGIETNLRKDLEKKEKDNPGLHSLGIRLTQNPQFKWWVKASHCSDQFARECEKVGCEFPMQLVHALMNSFSKFHKEIDLDPKWKERPDWKELLEKGYAHAVQLSKELRDVMYKEENLVLPWFAIMHFMLKPLAQNKPVAQKLFGQQCNNYIVSVAPRMEEAERRRCCHFSTCRYVEMFDGLMLRYRKIKLRLKQLHRPANRGLLEADDSSKRPEFTDIAPMPTKTFQQHVLDNINSRYLSFDLETTETNRIVKERREKSELQERNQLLQEDSVFMFVIFMVFGYHIK